MAPLWLAVVGLALGQAATPLPQYRKIEMMVPMRDGVRLSTQVYVPVGVPGDHPILLERTPYGAGPYDQEARTDFPGSDQFQEAGYIFVFQDVRGRRMSEGDFVNIRPLLLPGEKGTDESTDAWDTIDHLVKNVPGNNGRVGIWGISYPAYYATAATVDGHPALKAASPQAPVSDWFIGDDFHHNGAFFLLDAFGFLSGFALPRKGPSPHDPPGIPAQTDLSAYDFFLQLGPLPEANRRHFKDRQPFWNDLMAHGTYDDFWKARSLQPRLRKVRCAVLTVGGLFDAEDLWGALNVYQAIERQNPGVANSIVMGPWTHGMWAGGPGDQFAEFQYGRATSEEYRETIEFPFFDAHLRGARGSDLPEATFFDTGVNAWGRYAQWPPRKAGRLTYHLAPQGALRTAMPKSVASDAYVYDPSSPTPYTGDLGATGRAWAYMGEDQRWATTRPDVLTYRSQELGQSLTVAGPVTADLTVATTGTDADFVVKLIDRRPDGTEALVRAEVMRGKFRTGFDRPTPFVPGRKTSVKFTLNDVLHTFKPGHRVQVQIQSAWFPLVDRNPNTFTDIYRARPEQFRPATIRIFHGSKIVVGTLPAPPEG